MIYNSRSLSKLLLIILIVLAGSHLFADIGIRIRGGANHSLPTRTINGIEYTKLDDLSPIFKSIVKHEASDHRIFLHIYGEQFIFLQDTPYYTINNANFNMHYPAINFQGNLMVPGLFVKEHLAQRISDKISRSGNNLLVEAPVDRSVNTIVLDPGHGGRDPGAVGRTLRTQEKVVVLQVARLLKGMLERELGVRVLMTRDEDRFVSLGERTRFANENRADLFVSIHANASTNRNANGLETYYLAIRGTSDSRAVEALENNVVELYEEAGARAQYDALAFILSDLSQTEHLDNSSMLASLIHQNMVAGTRWNDRGVNQANFFVLRGAFMPAVLCEVGFISNAAEEARLINPQYQNRIARAIFEGVKRFKYRYDRIRNT
ncbi:MAG: N-acetylmuramoyl-L-alanine amidase [Candidatus Cloacimonadota bacterium]